MDGLSLTAMRFAASLIAAHGHHYAGTVATSPDRPAAPAYLMQADRSAGTRSMVAIDLAKPDELAYSSVPARVIYAENAWQPAPVAPEQPMRPLRQLPAGVTFRTCFSDVCRR